MGGIIQTLRGSFSSVAVAAGPTLVMDLDAANYSAIPSNGTTMRERVLTLSQH
jgi:hypothetical protein